ncbi:hypothetical protein Sjap_013692 [Stephania japonica]|uniref:HTH myb-type domain-containing protein n=1 Tax=Stephania japonica TaxID=461633 RepID=A0AAP0P078_9MAGN
MAPHLIDVRIYIENSPFPVTLFAIDKTRQGVRQVRSMSDVAEASSAEVYTTHEVRVPGDVDTYYLTLYAFGVRVPEVVYTPGFARRFTSSPNARGSRLGFVASAGKQEKNQINTMIQATEKDENFSTNVNRRTDNDIKNYWNTHLKKTIKSTPGDEIQIENVDKERGRRDS